VTWTQGRLKWDARLVAGGTPSTDDEDLWADGSDASAVPFVAIGDMSRRTLVRETAKAVRPKGLASKNMPVGGPGTLLLSMYASVGEVAFLGIRATWNQAILGITPDPDRVNPRFLAYALHAVRDQLLSEVRANTQANLNARQVGDTWYPRPPLDDQVAIADYLDHETAKIDTLIANQEALIVALRERRSATICNLLGTAKDRIRLRHAITLSQTGPFGTQLSASEYVSGGVPVINPTHIVRGRIDADQDTSVTAIKAAELTRFRVSKGDILLGRKGEVDKSALVEQAHVGWICGSDALLLRPTLGTEPRFLWWFLQSTAAHAQLERWSVGSTVAGLNQRTIAEITLPYDCRRRQQEMVEEIDAAVFKIEALAAKTEQFIALTKERRSALINAVVTGDVSPRA